VVVHRDAVGDGKLDLLKETEVRSIESAISSVAGAAGKKTSLTFVTVSKRIMQRIYLVKVGVDD
jgi:hypothetical protein